jgi:hypothetical protein
MIVINIDEDYYKDDQLSFKLYLHCHFFIGHRLYEAPVSFIQKAI